MNNAQISPQAIAAQRIIARFGGVAHLARALDIPGSTVQSWNRAGIPVKWQHPVIDAGKRAGVPITAEDFFMLPLFDAGKEQE